MNDGLGPARRRASPPACLGRRVWSRQARGLGLLSVLFAGIGMAQAPSPVLVDIGQQALLFRPEVRQRAADLLALSEPGIDPARLDAALAAVRDAPEHPPAIRDAILYQYLLGLRGRRAERMPVAALQRLSNHRAQAERLHEESSVLRVPLFDVATAAQGLSNERRHRELAERLLTASDDSAFLSVLSEYRDAQDRPSRSGIEAAVGELSVARLDRLAQQIALDPALVHSALALRVHLARGDAAALTTTLLAADATDASDVLRRASVSLPADPAYALAEAALAHPDPGVRGLAIAQASRLASEQPQLAERWQLRLPQLLVHPEDGVAAALHLARSLTPLQVQALGKQADADPQLRQRWRLVQHFAQLDDLREELP